VLVDREIFYAYCGNTAIDLDPLSVVEPALFELDVFEMAAPIQSPAKCEVHPVTISQRKRWTSSGNSQTNCCCLW